jgi:hypothetical protein
MTTIAPDVWGPFFEGLRGVGRLLSRQRLSGPVAATPTLTRTCLTVRLAQHMESCWADALAAFDAISPKLLDGASRYDEGFGETAWAMGEALGCERHAWGYHYLRDRRYPSVDDANAARARLEGEAAGRLCERHGVQVYWCNAEKHWAGVAGEPRTADPPGAMLAFVAGFRQCAPTTLLYFNGFSWAKTSDGRPLCTDQVLAAFDGFAPMVYGTTRRTIAKKWRRRYPRLRRTALAQFAPMVGTGRIGKHGETWGFHEDSRWGSPGLLRLNSEQRADWIAFFYDAGADGMLLEGNRRNPPLVKVCDAIDRRLLEVPR